MDLTDDTQAIKENFVLAILVAKIVDSTKDSTDHHLMDIFCLFA